MPYRSLVLTLVGLALALAAVGLWVRAVAPLVASTPSPTAPATSAASTGGSPNPGHQLRMLVKGTLMLTFTLICMLLVMGIFFVWRQWMRRAPVTRHGQRTVYVDAWKLAAERLQQKDDSTPE